MAEINVDRRRTNVWPWIIGLVILALLIWALAVLFDTDEPEVAEMAPVPAQVEPAAGTDAGAAGIPIAEILTSPIIWTGRTVGGEARVVDVPTDRGFWIEDRGERILVVLNDQSTAAPIELRTGQTLRIREATVQDNIASVPLSTDADTRRVAGEQSVFLSADERNIEVGGGAGGM